MVSLLCTLAFSFSIQLFFFVYYLEISSRQSLKTPCSSLEFFPFPLCTTTKKVSRFRAVCETPLNGNFQFYQHSPGNVTENREINFEFTKISMQAVSYLPDKIALNADTLSRVRTMTALLAGVVAGVLGITGVMGFVWYLLHAVVVSFTVHLIGCAGHAEKFFPSGKKHLLSFGELMSGLLSYVLMWTIVYDSIYIF